MFVYMNSESSFLIFLAFSQILTLNIEGLLPALILIQISQELFTIS